jgi:predicted RNA-binding protein with PUA-like domain
MRYWLVKSEPDVFSFDAQMAMGLKGGEWHGIRNYQARNNMRQMQVGDAAFFYHSNIGKEIVGICTVVGTSHPDSTTEDPRWDCADIAGVKPLLRAVTLEMCKADPRLAGMVLVNNTRLSVQPVTEEEWYIICALGGLDG